MKFGSVEDPSLIDFALPETHPATFKVLEPYKGKGSFEVFVGCAKWNKKDLKGFYPRGTKDELRYYATQFNSIELNATFYNAPSKAQVQIWKEKTPDNFKFFPKIPNSISHFSRLLNTDEKVKDFTDAVVFFEQQLGCVFLQLHDNFQPKNMDRLEGFIADFPRAFPLAVEVRNKAWFNDPAVFDAYCKVLETHNVCNIIVDTAGRRDMMHMRLSNDTAFVRYVGANHSSDYDRLDAWLDRIALWKEAGLKKLYFFIHQNIELESPLLATHFIQQLNQRFQLDLPFPGKNTPNLL